MTKKEYCLKNPAIACYSMGLCGLMVHGIEYGVDDYLYASYAVLGSGILSYHRLKIQNDAHGDAFVRLHGYKVPLNECIRMGD